MSTKTIIEIIILIGSFCSALGVIAAFLQKQQKKSFQKVFESDIFQKGFEDVTKQVEQLNERVNTIDKKLDEESIRQCRMYLVNFLTEVENQVPKDSVQIQLAYDVYEHYSQDLHCNSYVHDKWVKVMKNRKDLIV